MLYKFHANLLTVPYSLCQDAIPSFMYSTTLDDLVDSTPFLLGNLIALTLSPARSFSPSSPIRHP